VIEPLTAATVAEMVTLEAVPVAVTTPVALTVAQPLELCQDAELVTSLSPESNDATAFRLAVGAAEKLEAPVLVVTVTELGWLTKKPLHPPETASRNKAASAANRRSFGVAFDINSNPLNEGCRRFFIETAQKSVAEILSRLERPCTNV